MRIAATGRMRPCAVCGALIVEPVYWAGGLPPLVRRPSTPVETEFRPETAEHWFCGAACSNRLRSNGAKSGTMVVEVNSSPGLEGVENATGVDVAGAVISFLEKNAKFGHTRTKGTG